MKTLGPRFYALLFTCALVVIGSIAVASDLSPLMGMTIPAPGDPGPTYASNIQDAFEIIDAHDHTTGKGTKVPTAGINVNADLEMNLMDLTEVRTIRFDSTNVTIAATDRRAVYVSAGNLWFIDESGNTAQITDDGDIYGTPGTITGMDGTTAGVAYSDVTKTFSFTQNTGFPAKADFSTVRIAENVSGGKGPILTSNAATTADYNLIWPAALPGSTLPMQLSATGDISAAVIDYSMVTAGMPVGFGQTTKTATQTITAQIPIDDTVPQSTEGTEIFTLAYTPKKTGNLLEIDVVLQVGNDDATVGDTDGIAALFKDADASALVTGVIALPLATTSNVGGTLSLHYELAAPSTSAITFKVRGGSSVAGTEMWVNHGSALNDFGGTMRSILRVTEVAQ